MRLGVAVIISLISAAILPNVSAQQPNCRIVGVSGASVLEECGDQLNSFTLSLSAIKRQSESDMHGRFYFFCPVEPICENEPTIGGFFIAPTNWWTSSKDVQAIFQVMRSIPLSGGQPPPMPSAACPVFDVSIGGMTGRGVCFDEANAKNGAVSIVVVAANDRVGFLLSFSEHDKPVSALRDKVLELLPSFEIERATG